MDSADRKTLPRWVWDLAFAASEASLAYDETCIPKEIWQAWHRHISGDADQQRVVLDFLATCTPLQAHHFLHCAGHTDSHSTEWDVVLRRADCDQATALTYVATFWTHYYDGAPEWLDDDVVGLMAYIRNRAWNGGFPLHGFDVPEGTLLELREMREVLGGNRDHPFHLPASFLAMSKKEAMYHKVCEKIMPRRRVSH